LALAFLFAGSLGLAVAVGYGRAALVPTAGLPDRYSIVTVPILICVFFVWQLHGSTLIGSRVLGTPVIGPAVLAGMALASLAVLPANVAAGYGWRDWYVTGMQAVERDLAAGVSTDELVARHSDFLMHWNPEQLGRSIALLRSSDIGPFDALVDGAAQQP